MRVRILLTDGQTTVDYAWLEHTGADVYCGLVGWVKKFSYHESGQAHWSDASGEKDTITKRAPLKEVSGSVGIVTMGVMPDLVKIGYPRVYTGKKADASLFLDVRAIPDDRYTSILLGLIEPGRFDAIPILFEPWFQAKQVVLVTSVEPWVSAVVGWPAEEGILEGP
ncbi:MAG: hypothetical protein JSU86_04615 [Phycisphaerales bacterium]|nr:MAG: hypothetical protein JSU86_04615 [Phycisphaerales bacterium]